MSRISQLKILTAILMAILSIRLVDLQVLQGQHYRDLARKNRIRFIPKQAPRGRILDRKDRVLASNQTIFQVAVVPQDVEDMDVLLDEVALLSATPPEELRRNLRRGRSYVFMPATIVSRVSKPIALRLEEERWRLAGLIVKPLTVRDYVMEGTASHLLGYLSQPKENELPLLKRYGIRPQYLIGRTGLERTFDYTLRGYSGGQVIEVNHRGHQINLLKERPPQMGGDVKLTIDAQLHSLIEEVFGDQKGAAVVLNPKNGEVLAMVSVPGFNPEDFVLRNLKEVRDYLSNPDAPLMNRAIMGVYPPGSIAKLVVAAAALEQGVVTPHSTITCEGAIRIGDRTIHCWKRDGHGPVNLQEAIRTSCNVYFMTVGRWMGIEMLRSAYTRVGFAKKTGFILTERSGHLPNRRVSGGEVALLAIGQGPFLVTPLQLSLVASLFANGGWVLKPWLVSEVNGQHTDVPGRYRLGWSDKILDTVRAGMADVVAHEDGTGIFARSELITIAGKTGTAQTGVEGENHGWFAGYCPVEDPKVAFAIVAELGGSGGSFPADMAKTICEYVHYEDYSNDLNED